MDRFSKNTSMYFPHPDFPCGRIWEQKNHSPDTIRKPGRTVLGIEIPCWEADEKWGASDLELFENTVRPFEQYGFFHKSDVDEYFTLRLGHVYPVWDIHYQDNLSALLEFEGKIENLIFNGRPGLFFYNNLHHSLEMGFLSAQHVLSGQRKEEKWNIDRNKFGNYILVE